ncbi:MULTISPECIES: LLM class flavin-dependent oxidoreductase [Mycolicibacterium]|uniref:Luciferase-like domain-containing protein n=1 Tax=Mycolicibacterium wolinskyi TaxID=59750 RepID=A0A1X2FLB3_9MYCO|nr:MULTISPECIES: LLM class flavin-dependent oxidoreductase [Mycolicibacterium]ORX19216.1 hypothetical protein AWC31_11635 [Mycolicibacterium wolinskyi]
MTELARPPRIGVVFRPDFRPDTLMHSAKCVQRGADELWLWEDCFLQGGIAQAAVALAATDTLTVGLGVLPTPLRNVVSTAMEIATLASMFPGRIRVGVGHGVQSWMHQAGAAVSSPLTLLREYVSALRDLLAGRSVTVEGRYVRLDGVQLEWAPQAPVPVLIGGTGPKTLQLAGVIGDGVIVDSENTVDSARAALDHVAAGRARRDDAGSFATVQYLACAPGPDGRRLLAEEAEKRDVPEDSYGVGGTVDEIAGAVAAYLGQPEHTVVLQPVGPDVDMDAFATTVREVVAHIRATDGR